MKPHTEKEAALKQYRIFLTYTQSELGQLSFFPHTQGA